MPNIQTNEEMQTYIKQELGFPVVNVELDNVQLNNIIDDTIQFYNDENYGEGSYRTYLSFTATSGIDEYVLSGNNIQDVFDFSHEQDGGGLGVLFAPINTVFGNSMGDLSYDYGNYVTVGGSCQGRDLTGYQIAMSKLQDYINMFSTLYRVDWWGQTETLKITPTPKEDLDGILLIYKKSEAAALYNNRYVKKLAVGYAKKLWGSILGKTVMTLPGGGSFNGEKIEQQGIIEIEKEEENIRKTSEPINFYVE